ncbi:uncharacterized protein [Anser cygnoides]|uniref:uncharacterized protein isoform X2 n=1 Tax=Anser cygnoides TaxID=8845 RepID=UPI0034D19343
MKTMFKMKIWRLEALLAFWALSIWGLYVLGVPRTPYFLVLPVLTSLIARIHNTKAKDTSGKKMSLKGRRKKRRVSSRSWHDVEVSANSLLAGSPPSLLRPQGKGQSRSNIQSVAASATRLPWETAAGHEGRTFVSTSSEFSRIQPSVMDMQEISRSLMESLDTREICLDLLGKMNEIKETDAQDLRRALNKVFPICLKCRRCLTSSCPHHSKTAATHAVPTLTIFIHSLDILVYEEEMKLKVGLGFELAVFGKVVHEWKKIMELPKTTGNEECCEECCEECGEEYCEECGEPLPRDTQEGSSLQKRPSRKEERDPKANQRGTHSTVARSVALHGAGQGDSLHTPDPMWPLPPWAQPPSPDALDRLQRAGMEPLPQVIYMGLGQCGLVQCLRRSWGRIKNRAWRNTRRTTIWLQKGKNLGRAGPTAGDQLTSLEMTALSHTMSILV